MPITRKEFERRAVKLEKEIVDFLNAHVGNAYTSDEIMAKTSFHTEFDFDSAPKITVLITANFVAFINDLAAKGKIRREVVNNRMYFTAADVKHSHIRKKKRMES
jgi:predicted pyridoxine 5'-phosphate oxidase superfamily flavin-nucleotide-binding protein